MNGNVKPDKFFASQPGAAPAATGRVLDMQGCDHWHHTDPISRFFYATDQIPEANGWCGRNTHAAGSNLPEVDKPRRPPSFDKAHARSRSIEKLRVR